MDKNEEGFRFSLRTMLIGFFVVGGATGILGSLFLQSPRLFFAIWSIGSVAVPFLLAIITIVSLSRKLERGKLIAGWAAILAAAPFVGFGFLAFFQFMHAKGLTNALPTVGPRQYGAAPTEVLLSDHLPNRVDEPWVWNELEKRLVQKQLAPEKVDEAISVLTNYMKQEPNGWDRPLSWQKDFLNAATGVASTPVVIDLHDAYFGKAKLDMGRVRESEKGFNFSIEYGSSWADNSDLEYRLLWNVKSITLDDQPMKFKEDYRRSTGMNVQCQDEVASGEHQIKLVLEAAYVKKEKLVGLNPDRLETKNWPSTVKTWEQEISLPFKVYSAIEEIISLATDKDLDPTRHISVELIAQKDGDKQKLIAKFEFLPGLSVPCSFDAFAVAQGQEIKLGRIYTFKTENSTHSSGRQMTKNGLSLSPDLKYADIVLTPNPSALEKHVEVKQIWGKKVLIKSVTIDRLDLDRNEESEN